MPGTVKQFQACLILLILDNGNACGIRNSPPEIFFFQQPGYQHADRASMANHGNAFTLITRGDTAQRAPDPHAKII